MNDDQIRAAKEAARYAIAHACARMIKRVGGSAKNASVSLWRFAEFCASLHSDHREVFRSEFGAAERIAAAINPSRKPEPGEIAEYALSLIYLMYRPLCGASSYHAVDAKTAEMAMIVPQRVVDTFVE